MKKCLIISTLVTCLTFGAVFTGCSLSSSGSEPGQNVTKNQFTVSFNTDGGTVLANVSVSEGDRLSLPASPVKDGFVFAGWYTDNAFTEEYNFSSAVSSSFTLYAKWVSATSQSISSITYKGTVINLDDHNYYVDSSLTEDKIGLYSFTSLQKAIAGIADNATEEDRITIYLAPDVYWTDDFTLEAIRQSNDLVGLTVSQRYITLRGLTGNRDDVVICSDRGQNAGANGNFNTMAIADGFNAYDITFANFCNVDLDYKRDPSKSHSKRQAGITQAQVLITTGSSLDKLYFENCSFISRLNLLALGAQKRSYFKNCHFECTDDAMPGGLITVIENCDMDWYSSTPHYSSCSYLQNYLGCKITTHLGEGNKGLTLSKYTCNYAFIDCEFDGDLTKAEYRQNYIPLDTRCIVYNNSCNGSPFAISESSPFASIVLDEKSLSSFKCGDKYNVYNLLNTNGLDEWDPNNEKESAVIAPWYVKASVNPSAIEGDNTTSAYLSATVYGGSDTSVTWSLPSDSILTLTDENKVTSSPVTSVTSQLITATADNGISGGAYISVKPIVDGTPVFTSDPALTVKNGNVYLAYSYSSSYELSDENPDESLISWYRATDASGSDKVKVGESRYVSSDSVPYTVYKINEGDEDYYILAEVTPKQRFSNKGESKSCVTEAKICKSDIADVYVIEGDFEHLVYSSPEYKEDNEWSPSLKNKFWYGGVYVPYEYREGNEFFSKNFNVDKNASPWIFGEGINGALGKYGYMNNSRGARLIYNNTDSHNDMKVTLTLNPEKTAAQGFGSASQFLDIFIKYDQATKTGYGLRILRQASVEEGFENLKDYVAKSCVFKLMKFDNGVATQLESSVISTAYLPVCTVVLQVSGNEFTCEVNTTSSQGSSYPSDMPHSVSIKHTLESVNIYSGFGLEHTGTVSAGNRTSFESVKIEY